MTWWLWLIGCAWAAVTVGLTVVWALDWHENHWRAYYDGIGTAVSGIILVISAVTALVFVNHFDPGSDSPPPKTRTCTIQEMQQVLVGKTYQSEWVCIGWTEQ